MSQEDSVSFNRVTIVGPGLLGASIGLALKEKGITKEIWVNLRDPQKKKACERSNWCEFATLDLKEAVTGSDLVILCTPVTSILEQISKIANWASPECLITDVGSVKKNICEKANEYFSACRSHFIGSHPMAGSEKAGMKYASAEILHGKNCIVTPYKEANHQQVIRLSRLWEGLGMKVTKLDAVEHDILMSWISHLPHLVASCLTKSVATTDMKKIFLSGNGLRDTTRIASGNPELWSQILLENRNNLQGGINVMIKNLQMLKEILGKADKPELVSFLQSAKEVRDQLNEHR